MNEPPRLRSVPAPGQRESPLESWKEIAAYLNRTIRTARRWESTEGLPVHRHGHHKRDSVYAYQSELDEWWNNRRVRLEPNEARAVPRGRKWLAAGGAVALGLAAAGAWLALSRGRPALPFVSRDWILVADFNNRTGEPVFDNSLSTAFTVGLQQSAHVNVLPTARVGDALRRMGKDANTRIDEGLGREICFRENAKALVVCDLTRAGRQYAVSARLVDPRTDETVRVYLERAKDQDEILGALGEIARRVRKDLGESLSAIRQNNRPLPRVTTPSLPALQLYAEGRRRWRQGAHQDALRLYRSALSLDGSFAMAHAALGSAYCSHVFSDLAKGREHYEKALSFSDRITDRERLLLLAGYQADLGSVQEALAIYRTYLQNYPDDAVVRYDLGSSLMRSNRPAEAIAEFKEAVRVAPGYASAYVNLATSYNLLGNSIDALRYYTRAFELEPEWPTLSNLNNEYGFTLVHAGNAAKAREVFALAAAKPGMEPAGLRSMALLDMYEGKYRDAESRLREAIALSVSRREWLRSVRNHIYLAMAHEGTGNRAAQMRALEEAAGNLKALGAAPAWASARIGTGYLRAGSLAKAERMRQTLIAQADDKNVQDPSQLHLLEGEMELARGKLAHGIELLTLADREASTPETLASLAGAQQKAGAADQAISLYERLAAMGRQSLGWEAQAAWIAAHVRLAELYASRGESAKALRALDAFARLWSGADRDLPLARDAARLRSRLLTRQ